LSKQQEFDQYVVITRKWCSTGHKLVLFTNRKSHTGFQSVPKSMTLNDLERATDRHATWLLSEPTVLHSLMTDRYCQWEQCSSWSLVIVNICGLWGTTRTVSAAAACLGTDWMLFVSLNQQFCEQCTW